MTTNLLLSLTFGHFHRVINICTALLCVCTCVRFPLQALRASKAAHLLTYSFVSFQSGSGAALRSSCGSVRDLKLYCLLTSEHNIITQHYPLNCKLVTTSFPFSEVRSNDLGFLLSLVLFTYIYIYTYCLILVQVLVVGYCWTLTYCSTVHTRLRCQVCVRETELFVRLCKEKQQLLQGQISCYAQELLLNTFPPCCIELIKHFTNHCSSHACRFVYPRYGYVPFLTHHVPR